VIRKKITFKAPGSLNGRADFSDLLFYFYYNLIWGKYKIKGAEV
jgi:hypothetical protein